MNALATRIFLATSLVIVLVLGGALVVTRRHADRAADASTARALAATRSAIDDALAARSETMAQVASRLVQVPTYVARVVEAIGTGDRADLLDQADEFRSQMGVEWTLLTDDTGLLQAWTEQRDAFGEDFSGGALVGHALAGETTQGVWVEPGPAGDLLYQAVAVPITDPGGARSYGVLVAAEPLDSAFAARLERQTDSRIVLFVRDTAGTPHVVATTLADAPAIDSALAGLPAPAPDAAAADTAPARRFRLAADGDEWVGTAAALRTADGTPVGGYVALRSRDAELAAYRQLRRTVLTAFGVGLVLALAAALLVARRVTEPLGRLVTATRRVSEGQYDVALDVHARGEVGELAASFQQMLDELRQKNELVAYLGRVGARPGATEEAVLAADRRPASRGPEVGALFASRYMIEAPLGAGAMGVVYRAHDRQLGETVAVKTLRDGLATYDPTLLERFKQELRLARRITHRNVVRTYDLGEMDGLYYITMEYVEGTSLAELIAGSGPLPVPVALTIGRQLCRALEVAHEVGVIHRDIKPQNLVVDPTGFLKVMDFGIARLAEPMGLPEDALTQVGAVIGTPRYMAPEQLLGEAVDHRTDLYASGVVLYECLTGRVPFDAGSIAVLVTRHLRDRPEDPRALNPDVPERLAAVILRALATAPDDRWPSAAAMHRALDDVG